MGSCEWNDTLPRGPLGVSVDTRTVRDEKKKHNLIRPVGQAVKTSPSHGENMGSSPVRVTNKRRTILVCRFAVPYGKCDESIGSEIFREGNFFAEGFPLVGNGKPPYGFTLHKRTP